MKYNFDPFLITVKLDCGIRRPLWKKNSTVFRKIHSGNSVDAGEWPWYVSLCVKRNGKQFCGGSILSKRFTLTAHCFCKFTFF